MGRTLFVLAVVLSFSAVARADLSVADARQQIATIAKWEASMQTTCADAGADAGCVPGGVAEVETGPVMVSADNTAEAIFDFAYDERVTGDTSFHASESAAFDWLAAHTGYEQNTLYVGAYVCGWVLRAIVEYEATTGDASRHAFGSMCAQQIESSGPALASSTALQDVGSAAWAASGLWIWGDAYGDDSAHAVAEQMGKTVKSWVESAPASNLVAQDWAFSGAVAFHGVVGSYMLAHPDELVGWVETYAPMLGGWLDESTSTAQPDWRNAFNAWNMAAHFAAARALGSKGAQEEAIARDILAKLIAQEQAGTCAIPGSEQQAPTEAQSWLTSYLLYFGLREIVEEANTPPPPAPASGCDCNMGTRSTSDVPVCLVALVALVSRRRHVRECARASARSRRHGSRRRRPR